MTGADDRPLLAPDTPLASQNDMLTAAGADAPDGSTPPAAGAPGVADMEEVESFPPRADGQPRLQIVVRPRPDLLTDQPDEVAPSGAGPAEHAPLRAPGIEDRGPKSAGPSVPEDVDPVEQLVEFAFPTRSFTDWLIPDPLDRWQLFGDAIAKDRAGVDAALARARAVGYTASRFTDALKALIHVERGLRPQDDLTVGVLERGGERKTAYAIESRVSGDFANFLRDSAEAFGRIPRDLGRLWERAAARPNETADSIANSFPQTKIAGRFLSGATAIFGIAANYRRGRVFERSVLKALRFAKNNTKIEVKGVVGRSIPDALIGGVTEIKSGMEIDNSVQLRVHSAYARLKRVPFNLVVGPNTQRVSQTVRDQVRRTGGVVRRFRPSTGKFGPFR